PVGGIQSRSSAAAGRGLRTSDGGRVNIVEVLLDDMRVDDLAYAPHVRRLLAHDGITERNMFSSYPLCCPARASFYSGLLPHNHHVYSVWNPYAYQSFDDRATIATSLHQAGYSTGLIGKYLNGYGRDDALAPKLRWRQRHPGASLRRAPRIRSQYYVPDGWDQWYAGLDGTNCAPACGGQYSYFHYAYSQNGRPTSAPRGTYSSAVIAHQADHLIRAFHDTRRRTGKPFFLSVNFVAPHVGSGEGGRTPSCRYRVGRRTGTVQSPAAPAWAYRAPVVAGITRGAGVLRNGTTEPGVGDKPGAYGRLRELNASQRACVERTTRDRAAAVYATDRYVGDMIRTLKRRGEWDRTVFVFWSDNGYFQGEHHRMDGKIVTYEPVSRVPLIITGPGLRRREDRYDPMTVVDLSRTLTAIAGAAPPHDADGRDLSAALAGADTGWDVAVPFEFAVADPRLPGDHHRDPAFAPARRGMFRTGVRDGIVDPRTAVGLHTGRYYYLRYADGERELYDLWNDPDEWTNLAAGRSWLTAHRSLLGALDTAWRRLKDCAGSACSARLPSELVVDRAQNATRWQRWWCTMDAQYGTNHPRGR
ncbi:MAG: sulfatase-like hydrolase/transferase, partial [Actinomycetes bacterium]